MLRRDRRAAETVKPLLCRVRNFTGLPLLCRGRFLAVSENLYPSCLLFQRKSSHPRAQLGGICKKIELCTPVLSKTGVQSFKFTLKTPNCCQEHTKSSCFKPREGYKTSQSPEKTPSHSSTACHCPPVSYLLLLISYHQLLSLAANLLFSVLLSPVSSAASSSGSLLIPGDRPVPGTRRGYCH